jgi:hypothetical protein
MTTDPTSDAAAAAERIREPLEKSVDRVRRLTAGESYESVYGVPMTTAGMLAIDERRIADAYLAQSPTYAEVVAQLATSAADVERLKEETQWVRKKLKLPAEASRFDVYGKMHVLEADAHGYQAYIAAYKCDDKQGEIARLTHQVAALQAAAARFADETPLTQDIVNRVFKGVYVHPTMSRFYLGSAWLWIDAQAGVAQIGKPDCTTGLIKLPGEYKTVGALTKLLAALKPGGEL